MKPKNFLKMAALAAPLLLTACGKTSKSAVKDNGTTSTIISEKGEAISQNDFMAKVQDNAQSAKFVTSKVKFSVEVGQQDVTLTGNLKMKRDDVIRLQLMAFGFVEAARMEFTKEYVLIMDRINKQYIKAPYSYIDFLRNSGINFFTLQALFWDELFMPGQQTVGKETTEKYTTNMGGEDVVISYEDKKLAYSWLANNATGLIRMTNILYRDPLNGNTQLNWDYKEHQMMNGKKFPTNMAVTLTTPKKEVKLNIKLNYLNNESEWETRTDVSDKYREVNIDDILRRFMAL